MAIIIKNQGDDPWVLRDTRPNVTVPADGQVDLEVAVQRLQIVYSAQLLTDLADSALNLVVNDGSKDLTFAQAMWHIFGIGQQMPVSSMGRLCVEALKPTGGGLIKASHDFCDPTTWYGDSVRVPEEVLGCPTGDQVHFRSDYKHWINLSHGNVTREDDIINDTQLWPNGPFTIEVMVDGVLKVEGVDYIVDHKHGEVAFEWPNPFNHGTKMGMGPVGPSAVVKASYSRSNGSTWYLRPTPGKILLISNTEIQFSQGVIMEADIVFAPWIKHPQAGWIPVPGETVKYKHMKDLLNEGNKGTGTIAGMGGYKRGIRYPASVFPFDYLANKALPSSLLAELRISIDGNIPMDGEFGTVTCYCHEVDDPDYVAPE